MDAPKFTQKELAALFSDPITAARFPVLLTPEQAADFAQVSLNTIYDWSKQRPA